LADDLHGVRRRDDDIEIEVAGLDLLGEIIEADDVGTGVARQVGLVALGKDGDADALAGAGRSTTEPRTTWSDFLASTPRLTATSIDSSNLAVATSLTSASASLIG